MENEENTRRSKRIRKANSICDEATRNDERIREFVDVKVKVENFEDEFNSNTSTFQDAPDDKDYVKSLIEERGNTWDKPDEILCRNTELPKTSSGADMFPEISDIKKECDINTEDLAVSTENYSFRGDIDKNNVIADINRKKAKLVNDQCGSPSHTGSELCVDLFKQTNPPKSEDDKRSKCSISISKSSYDFELDDSTVNKEPIKQLEFQCDKCNFSTSIETILQLHSENVHVKGVFNCHLCRFTTKKQSYLQVHVNSLHFKNKMRKCHLCKFSCNTENQLQEHIDSVHIELNVYKCSECDFTAYRKSFLHEHTYNCHSKSHKCEICKVSFVSKKELEQHMFDFHGIKIMHCVDCGYTTTVKYHMRRHVEVVHLNKMLFKCDMCQYRTTRRPNLQRHIDSVHPEEKLEKIL